MAPILRSLGVENVRQNMDIIDSNRGKMWLSGQHNPMNWDSITLAILMIADKLDKDPVDVARLNLHGPDITDRSRSGPEL